MTQPVATSVGIDLGTTYSSLAYVDAQGVARTVADSSGQAVLPSVVYFGDEGILVGELALERARTHADRCVQFIKSQMGEPWRRRLGNREQTPESVSAMILSRLLREAEPQIGSIQRAVITVPAYFTEKRRNATQKAGEIAGLQVSATLNEPMAAALAFNLHRQPDATTLVYDLGGGTFDVTVVRTSPGEIAELATAGNRQLGGRDWDQALVEYAIEEFRKATGSVFRDEPQTLADLRRECERAKRRLSQVPSTSLHLQWGGRSHEVAITRKRFEDLTAHLLQATRLTTETALAGAGLDWGKISRLVLVGGSSQMPAVRELLERLSRRKPETGVNPVLAVALGAATYAHLLQSGQQFRALATAETREAEAAFELAVEPPPIPNTAPPKVRFVTAHGVGLKVRSSQQWVNRVLIPKNTPVPAAVTQRFLTRATGARGREVKIQITQGDVTDPNAAESVGIGKICGLPDNEPQGRPVDVTMQFDAQGRLHVRAVYVSTGQEMEMSLEIAGGLQPEEVREHRRFLEQAGLLEPVDPKAMIRAMDTGVASGIDETQDFDGLLSVDQLFQDLRVAPTRTVRPDEDLPYLEPAD